MKNEPTIEIAGEDDFEKIAEIYNNYIRLGESTMEESIHDAEKIAGWVKKFNDREKLYVLKKESTTIGWGIIKRYSDREGYRFACETAIYITESELRKGHGSRMKKHLIEECRKMKYRHLVAKIFATNTGSIQYNLRLGYSIVGIQKEIGFKNGKPMNIAIMQYIID